MSVLQAKFEQLEAGHPVIMTDEQYDTMAEHLTEEQQDKWYKHARSRPNPNQVGTLDRWEVSMRPFAPDTNQDLIKKAKEGDR